MGGALRESGHPQDHKIVRQLSDDVKARSEKLPRSAATVRRPVPSNGRRWLGFGPEEPSFYRSQRAMLPGAASGPALYRVPSCSAVRYDAATMADPIGGRFVVAPPGTPLSHSPPRQLSPFPVCPTNIFKVLMEQLDDI